MSLKIFHTADLHIGMRFTNYPPGIQELLKQARLDALKRMVRQASDLKCDVFVMAGDMFHHISGIDKKSIAEAAQSLKEFSGECVIVLPGNHDYDNDNIDLWKTFNANRGEKLLYVNREEPVSLSAYGLDAVVWPAPCHARHSDTNNVGWMKEAATIAANSAAGPEFAAPASAGTGSAAAPIHIGIAHGALEGISPDMDRTYYYMTMRELESLPMDVWLLGHTHVTYPAAQKVSGHKVFNPGSPEPDGLDFRGAGTAWVITIDDNRKVTAERVETGHYRFLDLTAEIRSRDDLDKLAADLLAGDPSKLIARLNLKGRVDEDTYGYRQEVQKKLEGALFHLITEESALGMRITPDKIRQEFTDGSFPQQFLSALSEDEDALQMAYELIREEKRK